MYARFTYRTLSPGGPKVLSMTTRMQAGGLRDSCLLVPDITRPTGQDTDSEGRFHGSASGIYPGFVEDNRELGALKAKS